MPKFEWTPTEVYEQLWERIENNLTKKRLVAYISTSETKEMIKHSQRKMLRWLCSEIWKHMWEESERVKQIFLIWCFGAKEMQMWKFKTDVAIKPTTSELTKTETIFYINAQWKFICDNNIPCKYTPRDIQSLLESYN